MYKRYHSEHYRGRPYLSATYPLQFFLPTELKCVKCVKEIKDPVRGTGSPRCVLSFGGVGKALLLPA